MPPFVHIAIAQFKPRKADFRANLERLGALFGQLDELEPHPTVLALPETALTGYFLEGGVREEAMTAGALAGELDATYRSFAKSPRAIDVTLGFYEVWNNKLYNSAMYVTLGNGEPQIRHVHRKMFLPTYGLFDEERFVERGTEIRAFGTSWGRAAMLVCEDAWHSMTATIAALDGAQIIFVCSAPPARGPWQKNDEVPGPESVSRWERLIRDIADEHGVYVMLSNLVGAEGGKLFAGSALVTGPKGEVRGRGPLWEEALVTATVDLADVTRARADMPLVADLEVMAPHLASSLDAVRNHAPVMLRYDGPDCEPTIEASRAPATRSSQAKSTGAGKAAFPVVAIRSGGREPSTPLEIDGELTAAWLTEFIREEMRQRNFQKALVGVSGGVDSAVTAYLAAKALGPTNVIGVRMPYRTSSAASLEHAQLVIDALGIQGETIDISPAVDGYLQHVPE